MRFFYYSVSIKTTRSISSFLFPFFLREVILFQKTKKLEFTMYQYEIGKVHNLEKAAEMDQPIKQKLSPMLNRQTFKVVLAYYAKQPLNNQHGLIF